MLPDSQLDRFMVMLTMGYPDEQSEVEILKGRQGKNPLDDVNVVASKDDIGKDLEGQIQAEGAE